jgi:catechol 2,3-dioxygenase-like lactoylglutathione lyase family enzyme
MKSNPAPPIHGVVETSLYVDDLARAIAFYREVLGLAPLAGDGERYQAFDSGAGRVLLLFKRGSARPALPAPSGAIPWHDGSGSLHVGFAISAGSFEDWRARLVGGGVVIESETPWERGGRSLFFRDPDGNLLELITPGIWPNY